MSMGGAGRGGFVSHGGSGISRGPVYAGAPHGGAYWGGGVHGGHGHGPYGYPGHYPYYPGRYYPWGYGYGWSWYPGWGWYGGVGWYGGDYSYPAQNYPSYVYAYPDNSGAYVENSQLQQDEIDRLNDEVARLREDRAQSPVPSPPKAQVHAETLLVFRDRHTEEIQNYAIVGKTLWVFTEQRARKIPIAELDVPATTKANEDRGITFRLPK